MSENQTAAPGEHAAGSFSREFLDRLNSIEARGKACGLTLTHICRESSVARATPDRWRNKLPLTIELIDKMGAVVTEREQLAERGKAARNS